jgi:hypothetical protein
MSKQTFYYCVAFTGKPETFLGKDGSHAVTRYDDSHLKIFDSEMLASVAASQHSHGGTIATEARRVHIQFLHPNALRA